jgi:SpoVK/Ycf46/Vps4 family AAA+-type ATPase/DNA-directed RNA polymerase subunit H (RpoH/RPB5)
MKTTGYYRNGMEHLVDELQKMDALIHRQVRKHNALYPSDGPGVFNGLYITGEEINRIMGKKPAFKETSSSPGGDDEIADTIEYIQGLELKILAQVKNSLERQTYLPLVQLALLFDLTPFERDILLVCLAPELDLKYEKIFAYLQDDVSKKQPSVNLILDLLCRSPEERTNARVCFLDHSSLLRYGLVTFSDDADGDNDPPKSLLSRCLKPDDRITVFLLGLKGMDSRLSSFAKLVYPQREWSSLVMEEHLKEQFIRLAERYLENSSETRKQLIFYLKGPYGVGKKSTAEAFCSHLQIPLLLVDTRDLLVQIKNRNSETDYGKIVIRLFRETLLQPAAIYFDGFDRLIAGADEGNGTGNHEEESRVSSWRKRIIEAVKEYTLFTFFAGQKEWHPPRGFAGRTFVNIDFPVPSYPQRERLWKQSLNGRFSLAPGIRIDVISSKFNFTAGQIRDALEEAGNCAAVRGCTESKNGAIAITMEDLYRSCHSQSNQKLSQMAQKVNPKYTWTDIVLPQDKIRQLKEICSHVTYRQVVYWEWGFGAKFSLGNGLNILFSGPSGTGKTMSAEIIAGTLGLELYKIDLSNVVSKYIGETEKNLQRIFKEAETANCILFFDEADALFGKRSEVKDSHDRYANIEINYLLQKMEEHAGIVILATNFLKNIDDAFKRRIHFSVDFPFPDEIYRLKIWQNIFPSAMPGGKGIDFEFLAKKFRLPGGNIKNIAVNAAFLAAENSQEVGMLHAIQATKRELQKMGKHCSPSDFSKYYNLMNEC